jgi:hypothetical protein
MDLGTCPQYKTKMTQYEVESVTISFDEDRVKSVQLGLEWDYKINACEGGDFKFIYQFDQHQPFVGWTSRSTDHQISALGVIRFTDEACPED